MKKIFVLAGYILLISILLAIADSVLGVHYLGSWWMGDLARLIHLAAGGATIFLVEWLFLEWEVNDD